MFLHIVLFFVAFFGLFFAVIITVKLRQVRAASRWPSVSGEIIAANVTQQQVTTHHAGYEENEDKTESRNFARITYRYEVNGKRYKCSRLSVGEDMGNDDVQGKLKRYPVGRTVEVFYNPADPSKAVLERDLPEGCGKGGLIGLALVAAIIGFFGYGLDYAVGKIGPHMKNPDKASMVVFAGTFSLLAAWFTIMYWRQGSAASGWRRVSGRIKAVENPQPQTPIVYSYEVDGVPYQSDVVDFGGNKHAVFKLPSGVVLRGGEPDQDVTVFHDPTDPTKACLHRGVSMLWLPLLVMLFTGWLTWFLFHAS